MEMHPIIHALGWTLLHSLWQGVVIWLLFSMSQLCIARLGPAVRHANAVFWLILFILLPIITSFVLLAQPASSTVTASALSAAPILQLTATLNHSVLTPLKLQQVEQWFPLIVTLWAVSALFFSTRTVSEWRKVRRFSHDRSSIPAFEQCFQRLKSELNVAIPVALYESIYANVPMVVGWLKPIILIPSSALLGLTRRELELIVAHELAHIKRLDHVINYLLAFAEAILFFHPAIYSITRTIRYERELCCDDLVVSNFGDHVSYARALTKLELLRQEECGEDGTLRLAATDGPLLVRVQRLARLSDTGNLSVAPTLAALSLVFILTFTVGFKAMAYRADSTIDAAFFDELDYNAIPQYAHEFIIDWLPSANDVDEVVLLEDMSETLIVESVSPPALTEKNSIDESVIRIEQVLEEKRQRDEAFVDVREIYHEVQKIYQHSPNVSAQDMVIVDISNEIQGQLNSYYPVDHGVYTMPAETEVQPHTQSEGIVVRTYYSSDYFLHKPPIEPPANLQYATTTASYIDNTEATFVSDVAQTNTTASLESYAPEIETPADKIYSLAKAVEEESGGTLISGASPKYPKRARERGLNDSVKVSLSIDEQGQVSNIEILSKDSRLMFQRSVYRAVARWQFEPLIRNGRAVSHVIEQSFEFRLQDAV